MLKDSSFNTLSYFDIFKYPLTKIEMDTWGYQAKSQTKDHEEYEHSLGFYYLPGHKENINTRQERYIFSDYKIDKALKFIKIFRLLPSIRMIALCNSLGYSNASSDSDIDFFIIVQPGTIWLTRFWLQSFLRIFRLGPFDRGIRKDSLCLTFFLTSDNLNIKNLSIDNEDVYLNFWITQLIPIYDTDDYYHKFLQANRWVKEYLPDFIPYQTLSLRKVGKTFWAKLFVPLVNSISEKTLKHIQLKIMPKKLKAIANQDTRVVVCDTTLKFHIEDNRLKYKNLWLEKIKY